MKKSKIMPETEVSTEELACVLGLSGRRVRQLIEDGIIERSSPGRFNLADSVQRFIAAKSRGVEDDEDRRTERRKAQSEMVLKESKAEMAKLELMELQGSMHRSEDVRAMTEDLVFTMRSALLSLPGRLARDVADAGSAAEASDIIRREAYRMMEELSHYQYDPKKYAERVKERTALGSVDAEGDK